MPITQMTGYSDDRPAPAHVQGDPGVYYVPAEEMQRRYGENVRGMWLRVSHVGRVLFLGEHNGYHDSDFFAWVWNDTKGQPEKIEYATTRGWCYPNHAVEDATPETLAKYEAWDANRKRIAREDRATREAMFDATVPTKGAQAVIVKGRPKLNGEKVAKGTTGTVIWVDRNFPAYRERAIMDPLAKALGNLGRGYWEREERVRVGLAITGRKETTTKKRRDGTPYTVERFADVVWTYLDNLEKVPSLPVPVAA